MTQSQPKECAILLHGIANPALVMSPFEIALKLNGFDTINIEYPSRDESIDRLSKYIHKALIKKDYHQYDTIHFIAFSLGALVLRAYLNHTTPSNMGRVVMLGPPNQGTEAADKLKDEWYYQLFFGKAGQEVTTDRFSDNDHIDYELGIIAGTKSGLAFADLFTKDPLPKPHDGIIPVENTKISGMKSHLCIDTTHAGLIAHPKAIDNAVEFIKTGNFKD